MACARLRIDGIKLEMIFDVVENLWGYVWGRSWVYILARAERISHLMMTMTETTAAEISAIETSRVKRGDADLLRAWMVGKVTEAMTIESCG